MNFTKGDRVRHPGKPEWDMGQVLEDSAGTDVRVYFAGAGEKKLRLEYVTLTRVEGDAAANPVLDSLGKRQPRASAAGAKRGKKTPKTRSLAQLMQDFTGLYPEGFYDPKFRRDERDRKVEAHDKMADLLGREPLDALLAAGDHDEVGRRALQVIAETNLVFPREAIALKNGLKDESNQRLFAESLRALLYGDAEAGSRFAAFCDHLAGMGAAKWPLATYFPFVAFPEREMFLKPTVTRKVAEMLGFELGYSVEPNWLTYSKLLELSRHIFDSLAELRPRDMIDIQSFISRVAGYEEAEQAEGEPAANATPAARAAGAEVAAAPAGADDGAGEAGDAGEPPWASAASEAQTGATDESAASSGDAAAAEVAATAEVAAAPEAVGESGAEAGTSEAAEGRGAVASPPDEPSSVAPPSDETSSVELSSDETPSPGETSSSDETASGTQARPEYDAHAEPGSAEGVRPEDSENAGAQGSRAQSAAVEASAAVEGSAAVEAPGAVESSSAVEASSAAGEPGAVGEPGAGEVAGASDKGTEEAAGAD